MSDNGDGHGASCDQSYVRRIPAHTGHRRGEDRARVAPTRRAEAVSAPTTTPEDETGIDHPTSTDGPRPAADRLAARAGDLALEATLAPALTRIGYDVRHRLEHWGPPVERDLHGRTFVVTGATSGIGQEAAAMLLAAGAAVRSASRSPERAEATEAALRQRSPGADVSIEVADLTRPADVDRFTAALRETCPAVDGLAHGAGAFFPEPQRTPEGTECTAAVYLAGPHRLTAALISLLLNAPEPRVVFVSSSGAYLRALRTADLDSTDGYRPLDAYARAKRGQIALTHAWARRQPGIAFDAMTPGWCDTALLRQGLPRFRAVLRPVLRSPVQGADTLAWLLARPRPLTTTDRLWRDRRPRLERRFPWTLGGDGPDEVWAWCETRSRTAGVAPA